MKAKVEKEINRVLDLMKKEDSSTELKVYGHTLESLAMTLIRLSELPKN